MIFWSLCAFIWFKNIGKMLLQMTSGFFQLESTIKFLHKVGTDAVFFFLNSLSPFTTWPIRYLFTIGLFFSFFLMWCGGAPGYFPRPPTPTLSSPFSFFWTTQHEYNNTQHPWEAHPAWDSNPADLAMVSEECRSSFHHPTVSP
jgi:hypothetical protein